ncbi:MAG: tetratricopeptide repeat protein [Bacteriovoracaceae bacterium]
MVKSVLNILLAVVVLTLVSCSSRPKEMNKKAQLYFNAGTSSLINKEYTEALTNLLKANELEKNNPDVLNNLGMAYYFKGDLNLALKCLKNSLELNPKNSDAKHNIASILFEQGQIGDAERLYKEVLTDLTYEKQARTYYNLGILELEKKHDPVEAERYFRSSLKESEDYCPSHYKLGSIYYARHEYNKAYRSFREATMGTCFNSPAAHYQQALSLIELRKYSDARVKLDEIQNRFAKTTYAVKARSKMLDVDELEKQYRSLEAKSPRKVMQSPEF